MTTAAVVNLDERARHVERKPLSNSIIHTAVPTGSVHHRRYKSI